jgi:hypothetical protein
VKVPAKLNSGNSDGVRGWHTELPRLVDGSICYCSKRYLLEMYNEECEGRARCLVAFDLVHFELPVREASPTMSSSQVSLKEAVLYLHRADHSFTAW